MQENPYRQPPSIRQDAPPSGQHAPPRDGANVDRQLKLRVALLGLNAWVISLLVPMLHVGVDPKGALITSLPLVVLGLGLAALGRNVEHARWLLLAGYPPSIGGVLAWRSELTVREVHGTLGLALAALSLLAFTAAVARACAPTPRNLASPPVRLERAPVAEPARRRWLRRALLGISGAGSLALVLLAPTFLSRSERLERWGKAADDATVLAIVVATVLSCALMGMVVGPALRAPRLGSERPTQRQQRLAISMLIAVAAAVGWLVLRHFDRAAGL